MEKRELLRKLRKVGLGGKLRVNGKPFHVDEVVHYHEDGEKWLNLVNYQQDGTELALEVDGQEISLWREIKGVEGRPLKMAAWYHGERYDMDREESGVAKTILRKFMGGQEITKEAKTPYTVFVASSGRKLCLEVWDGKKCWYLSEPGFITISF